MKRWLNIMLIFCLAGSSMTAFSVRAHAETKVLSYEEFGRVAMRKTMEKYPDAQITDYLHVGKKRKAATSIETFKLTLKEKNKTFQLFVFVEYNEKTKKVVKVTFEKAA
ncbi:DUF3889 domain-containing protein [Metabacillus idriensis]|uniref:DUF3889 domain-containing protein n=1 Tax=Metabacillus idriensis TaxID=324768 RepID=UPI00281426B4|nr:DUF3889 domain-containing protein [Metabacillus idriensis]MDR0140248.1 DUF3889 domain-containing protein [Metabacillus idriensis]